jgi:hypothetical protein
MTSQGGGEHDGNRRESGGRLAHAIADLNARHGGRRPDPPESRLARVAAAMASGHDAQQRSGKDYNVIAELLAGELRSTAPISLRHARDGAWCLWETRPAIGAEEELLARFLGELQDIADQRASRALCNAYLVQYRQDRPGLRMVSDALEQLSTHAGHPYALLQRDLKLFSLPEGPSRLGRQAIERRLPPTKVLQSLGLESMQLSQGGFVQPCALAALQQLVADSGIAPRERLEFVKALAVDHATGKLYFPHHKTEFANALLLPYRAANPPADVQAETLAVLLRAIGDPRSRAALWRSMEDAARIARRWLTKESINQFLDVVDAVADDRMWPWRRKFWNAVFDTKGSDGQSIVQEAWVVFDDVGYTQARRMGLKDISVGRFVRGAVQSGQSVLLLRIGRMVIAEWSHSGKVRIWYDAESQGAPRLYSASYTASELRQGRDGSSCDWDRAHMSPESYAWQNALADKLHELTGMRVSRAKYW